MRTIRSLHPSKYETTLSLIVLVYIVVFSLIALMRYYTFRTYVDLGIFNQAFSSALHGKLFLETPDLLVVHSGSLLGTHFSLLLFLLVPLYSLHPGPEILLVVQTIFVALGAVPIFLTSLHVLKNQQLSLGFATVYLLNPAIHSMNMFDFHLEAFLPFFLGMFYFSLLKEKWWAYVLFLVLSSITIEFGPVMIFAICASYLLSNIASVRIILSNPKRLLLRENLRFFLPILTMGLAAASFYLLLVAAGHMSGTNISPQGSLSGFLPTVGQWLGANNELKLAYWGLLLGGLSFLPLLVPAKLLMSAPWMAVTLLTTTPAFTELGYQHAGAFVAPYLVIAAVFAFQKTKVQSAGKMLLASMIVISLVTTPLNPLVQAWIGGIAYEDGLPLSTAHDQILHRVIDLVPPDASVLTQNNLFGHFSNRPNAFVYMPNNMTVPSFILGDNTSSWYTIATVPPSTWYTYRTTGIEPVSDVVAEALSSGTYGIVARAEGVILLEYGYKGPLMIS